MLGQSDSGYAIVDTNSGAVIMPDNSVVMPDGSVVMPDGSVTPAPTYGGETLVVPTNPQTAGGSWVTILQNVTSGIASVLKGMTGTQSVPTGYHYDPLTGQMISNLTGMPLTSTSTMSSWLLPVALIGIGAVFLMGGKK